MAIERLGQEPAAAGPALAEAFESAREPWLKARLGWAAGMLPGQSEAWIKRLAANKDENLRIVALRMCRLTKGDVLALVEKFSADPAASVQREAAIALKGLRGERADRAWAALAARHVAGDRWELEALGIGADGPSGLAGESQWDGRLAAWLQLIGGNWKTPAGREVVWRSRAAVTPQLLCEAIGDVSVGTSESLAMIRAFDFQDRQRVAEAVRPLVASFAAPDEKFRVILPELVTRLDASQGTDEKFLAKIDQAADFAAGTQRFVEIVQRFGLASRREDVVKLAAAEGTTEQLASFAAGAAVESGSREAVVAAIAQADPPALRLLNALGIRGSAAALAVVKQVLADAAAKPELKPAAVRSLARSRQGAMDLVAMAKAGELAGPLLQVAALAVASTGWPDVKAAANGVLPMPKAKGGEKLPPIGELVKRSGDPARGKVVFAGAGTCAKCHVVGGEGKAVGPALSGIGAKLSRPTLYEAILAPSAAISHNYETWTAILDDGRSFTGLLVSQSPEEIVIRGPDGIDTTVAAGEVEELVKQPVSLMPADLALTLSAQELVDLVSWLETLKQTN